MDKSFDLMLSGHTHGGQIGLLGQILLASVLCCPRRFGAGAWKYHNMMDYTSVGAGSSIGPAGFNCLPEVTIHYLRRLDRLAI